MNSPLPRSLQQALDDAYSAMLQHSMYVLLPKWRQAVYRALGPLSDEGGAIDPSPNLERYRARLTLDLLTVRRVLPIWHRLYPNDPWPQRILDLVEDVLSRRTRVEVARAEAENASDLLDRWHFVNGGYQPEAGMTATGPVQPWITLSAYTVCLAAVEALRDAAGMNTFDAGPWDEEDTDADVDPGCTDVALWAASAYAGTELGLMQDRARCREFWEWWLKEAVPAAWQTSSQRRYH